MKTNASVKIELSPKQCDELLAVLKARFDANEARHPGLGWAKVQARLESRGGRQACVFYGAAEFSRDTDFAILADAVNRLASPRLAGFPRMRTRRKLAVGGTASHIP